MAYNPQNLHECEKEKKHVKRATIDTIMTVVGLIASISSIPQALKIYQTGDVSGNFAPYIDHRARHRHRMVLLWHVIQGINP